jgi:hypothetical protein
MDANSTNDLKIPSCCHIEKLSTIDDSFVVKAWAMRMSAYLKVLEVWSSIFDCPENLGKKGALALHVILNHISDSVILQLNIDDTYHAEEIWSNIRQKY